MKILNFLVFLFFFFVVFLCEPFAQSVYVYVFDSNSSPTVGWDISTYATYYEIRLVGIKKSGEFVNFPSETITVIEKKVYRPRSGDFKVQVRACNSTQCSEWSNSNDSLYATVNGSPMGWLLRWKVSKPSNIIIGLWNKFIIDFIGGIDNV